MSHEPLSQKPNPLELQPEQLGAMVDFVDHPSETGDPSADYEAYMTAIERNGQAALRDPIPGQLAVTGAMMGYLTGHAETFSARREALRAKVVALAGLEMEDAATLDSVHNGLINSSGDANKIKIILKTAKEHLEKRETEGLDMSGLKIAVFSSVYAANNDSELKKETYDELARLVPNDEIEEAATTSLPKVVTGSSGWELGNEVPVQDILRQSDIKEICEPGAVAACECLWRLNIRTVSSSANTLNDPEQGYHFIELAAGPGDLSQENRQALLDGGIAIIDRSKDGRRPRALIKIGVQEGETDEMIEARFLEKLADLGLTPQAPNWVKPLTMYDMKKRMFIKPDEEVKPEAFVAEGNYYYDEPTGYFFRSKELRDKWAEWEDEHTGRVERIDYPPTNDEVYEMGIEDLDVDLTLELEALFENLPEYRKGTTDMLRYALKILEPDIARLNKAKELRDEPELFKSRNILIMEYGTLKTDLMRSEDRLKYEGPERNRLGKISFEAYKLMTNLSPDDRETMANLVLGCVFKSIDDEDGLASHREFLNVVVEDMADEAAFLSFLKKHREGS